MGNDASKQRSNTNGSNSSMGSRQASLTNSHNVGGGGGMGRRSTSSFDSTSLNDGDTYHSRVPGVSTPPREQAVARLRGVQETSETQARRLAQTMRNNNNKSADLFETPRTVFLEYSHASSEKDPRFTWEVIGTVEIELFPEARKASEQFFFMCTGEKREEMKNDKLYYKDCVVHRIIPGFMAQGGDTLKGNGTGTLSIYGEDEKVDHGFPGRSGTHFPYCVSVAHAGVGSKIGTQFFIMSGKCKGSWLDRAHQVFGKVVSGETVCDIVESYGSANGKTQGVVFISNCGETEKSKMLRGVEQTSAANMKTSSQMPSPSSATAPTTATAATTTTSVQQQQKDTNMIPNAPNGVINPPFVRAFENAVLPLAMQNFVQDFLRIIECSVCLCSFDAYSRLPCTLACGHSICFNHLNLIETCPMCRQEITGKSKIQPNIVLKEICAKFAPTDVESIELSKKSRDRATTPRSRNTALLAETEGRHIDFNAPAQVNRVRTPPRTVVTSVVAPTATNSRSRTLVLNRTSAAAASTTTTTSSRLDNTYGLSGAAPRGQRHTCPAACSIARSQRRCCWCCDTRKVQLEYTYEEYIDGRGFTATASRWKHYCPVCVSACSHNYHSG